jgi:predicted dehydrogenase
MAGFVCGAAKRRNPAREDQAMTSVDGGRKLRVGVLGCGQIAQAAHFESCTKAKNAELYAICDVSSELLGRMAEMHRPTKAYPDYAAMLADPDVEAVVIATSDAFHVSAAIRALEAGKHVLCEKPLGLAVEEVEALRKEVSSRDLVLHVGHMKRFDPGIQSARAFIRDEMGDLVALKAWYCDSTHRYSVTDAVQPAIVRSRQALKPAVDPKSNLRRYYMLAHGSHLLDTARFLAGDIVEVEARFSERGGMRCWFVDVAFASGAMGHLDLTVAVRMDWHEGFQVYGRNGSVIGKTFNPWLYRASEVEIFRESDGAYHRTLGADAHFYRRQLEAFADSIIAGGEHGAAEIDDGVASVRAMVAVGQSIDTGKPVRLADVCGAVS